MKKGDKVYTPRFCTVEIEQVFNSKAEAIEAGYTESTYYKGAEYDIRGKSIGINRMIFAAIKK